MNKIKILSYLKGTPVMCSSLNILPQDFLALLVTVLSGFKTNTLPEFRLYHDLL